MEGDTIEIKNEPKNNYESSDSKISDGIDHSGLFSMLVLIVTDCSNQCASSKS